jgi:hypothetical protein
VTPEEARAFLRLDGPYTEAGVKAAFRTFARENHPDMHPHVDADQREWRQTMFDLGARARDILLDVLRKPPPKPEPASPPHFEQREQPTPPRNGDYGGSHYFSATWEWTAPFPGSGQRQPPPPPPKPKPKPKPMSREDFEHLLDEYGFTPPAAGAGN